MPLDSEIKVDFNFDEINFQIESKQACAKEAEKRKAEVIAI